MTARIRAAILAFAVIALTAVVPMVSADGCCGESCCDGGDCC